MFKKFHVLKKNLSKVLIKSSLWATVTYKFYAGPSWRLTTSTCCVEHEKFLFLNDISRSNDKEGEGILFLECLNMNIHPQSCRPSISVRIHVVEDSAVDLKFTTEVRMDWRRERESFMFSFYLLMMSSSCCVQ